MINESTDIVLFTHLQILGIVITLFGIAIVALALRRLYLRRSIQGIHTFALTDRFSLSKRSELTLQKMGLLMVLGGMILIAADAVQEHQRLSQEQQKQVSSI